MWRAFFLGIGVFLIVLGAESLAVDTFHLRLHGDPPPKTSPWDNEVKQAPQRTLTPPPWAPYSLMATGAVVCLYSFTIPRRVAGK
jgi:hypothetical protein